MAAAHCAGNEGKAELDITVVIQPAAVPSLLSWYKAILNIVGHAQDAPDECEAELTTEDRKLLGWLNGIPRFRVLAQGALEEGEAELDITVDSELLPLLPPGFLESQLAGLAAGAGASVRAPRLVAAQAPHACGAATGLARWLCEHRVHMLWALAAESAMLAGVLAAYVVLTRARRAEPDPVRVPWATLHLIQTLGKPYTCIPEGWRTGCASTACACCGAGSPASDAGRWRADRLSHSPPAALRRGRPATVQSPCLCLKIFPCEPTAFPGASARTGCRCASHGAHELHR